MQRRRVLSLVIFIILAAPLVIFTGHCCADNDTFEQLRLELKKEGVSDDFIKTAESSVKRMISSSASVPELKLVLMDLWKEGRTGRALKNAVASVAELVASGDNTLEAAKVASGAAHKAEAEGLSGFSVAMKVKKAVKDRQEYLKTLKK